MSVDNSDHVEIYVVQIDKKKVRTIYNVYDGVFGL